MSGVSKKEAKKIIVKYLDTHRSLDKREMLNDKEIGKMSFKTLLEVLAEMRLLM